MGCFRGRTQTLRCICILIPEQILMRVLADHNQLPRIKSNTNHHHGSKSLPPFEALPELPCCILFCYCTRSFVPCMPGLCHRTVSEDCVRDLRANNLRAERVHTAHRNLAARLGG